MIKKFIIKLKTSYRRIDLPIKRSDFVVDIGSGGLPNPYADLAIDFMDEDYERDTILKIDRPFVWANAEQLPLKDKAFDFSVFSHVLEHMESPDQVLCEIERVSKAGYIETPNSFYEVAYPHDYHLSRVSLKDDILHIYFKNEIYQKLPNEFEDLNSELSRMFYEICALDPRLVLTRYHWNRTINYEIHGTQPSFSKVADNIFIEKKSKLQKFLTSFVYMVLKPRKQLELNHVLACPSCKGELDLQVHEARCLSPLCQKVYFKYRGYYDFRIKSL
jgi:SAM-dependent methyltransferase